MRRLKSKILATALILAMVFASTGTVFGAEMAGLTKIPSGDVTAEKNAVSVESDDENIQKQEAVAQSKTLKSSVFKTASKIKAKTILYSTTSKTSKTYYDIQPDTSVVIPVVAQHTGRMFLDAKNISGGVYDSVSVYLCKTKADAKSPTGEYYEWHYLDSGESEVGNSGMPVTAGKTYYISIENDYYNDYAADIRVSAYVYTTGARTLYQGTSKWTVASGVKSNGRTVNTTYFKVKPNRTGMMTVKLKEFDNRYSSVGNVTLYDSKKRALSNKVWYDSDYSSDRVYFGVKKGVTYYLKVTDCYGNSQDKFGICYSVTKKTDKALASKSKAKKLTRKASATNYLFTASRSQSVDWYKIYVPYKKETVIGINTTGIKSGNIYIAVYKGSKRIGSSETISAYENTNRYELTYGTTYGKANAGTYYIKVVKGTKASGSYKIRHVY